MRLAIASAVKGAAFKLAGQGGAALLGVVAAMSPLSAAAQEASGQDNAPVAVSDGQADSDFTPLKEVLRVRDEACGKDQFDSFLYWYTISTTQGGWLEQVVFTNYLVKIANLNDPDEIYDWEDRMDYIGQFRVTSMDVRASAARPNDGVNPEYRRIATTKLNDLTYRVDWAGGPGFAGVPEADQFKPAGAYIFEYMHDCWYLTQDLR